MEIRVRYCETDAMGVAHHSVYTNWLEAARIAMLDELGLPYKTLEAGGCVMPVVELGLKYRRPCRFHDLLSVTCLVQSPPRATLRVDYEIHCEGELVATAHTVLAFVTPQGQVIRPPTELVALLQPVTS